MTALVARPEVWTDKPDDLPDLLAEVGRSRPNAVTVDMPRGMAAPKRLPYLQAFCEDLRDLGYVVNWRAGRLDGEKRVIVVGHRKIQ